MRIQADIGLRPQRKTPKNDGKQSDVFFLQISDACDWWNHPKKHHAFQRQNLLTSVPRDDDERARSELLRPKSPVAVVKKM